VSDYIHFDALHHVGKTLGIGVRRCEAYDPNVCRSRADKTTEEIRSLYKHRKLAVSVNPEYVCVQGKGDLQLDGMISINRPNKIYPGMERTQLLIENDSRWPVFIPGNTRPSRRVRLLLASSRIHHVVETLLQEEGASLHIFEGEVVLYSRVRNAEQLKEQIDILLTLVRPPHTNTTSVDLSALPDSFRHLAPLIQKWAEPDDAERGALIEESPEESLRELVEAVDPEFGQINRYLDSFRGGTMPEAGTALSDLAEAASEAKLRLKGRR
jgi:hypothetical protein